MSINLLYFLFADVKEDESDKIVVRCIECATDWTKCLKTDINYTCEKRSLVSGPLFHSKCYKNFCDINTFLLNCGNNRNIYVWLCQDFSLEYWRTYNNIHIHTYPIQESIKFDSLFSSFSSATRKFFHIMDPANLHSESEKTTVT